MTDPFWLPPYSIISFSGGKTSGYMLRRHLDAHGGSLPENRLAVFCNTGREREETLDFVRECGERWGVPIVWLEYRYTADEDGDMSQTFAQVDHATASRNGEPFLDAIRKRKFLPNPVMRFCTGELKIKTTWRFVRYKLGWREYGNSVGLRADEPTRVNRMRRKRTTTTTQTLFGEEKTVSRGADLPPGESVMLPLADAGIRHKDVLDFWERQPFILGLQPYEGNCDLCFLKGAGTILRLMQEQPERAGWWRQMEASIVQTETARSALFRKDRPSYEHLFRLAQDRTDGPLWSETGGHGATSCGGMDECRCTD